MRLLLIEDDTKLAAFIEKGLREAGFVVEHAVDGRLGLQTAIDSHFDAAVIDIMLPRLDGLSVIDELRRRRVNTPVIILSARRSVDERVQGLQAGGDDYLTKPFSFTELLARIHALIRRASDTPEPTGISVGDLSCDRSRTERGNGLGLSLALALVRLHGGDIAVESKPDRGSTFIAELPRAAPAVRAA